MTSIDAAKKQILAHYLELDKQGNFVNAPKTDDELWEFIFCAYNVRIPRKTVTRGHRSPFEFVSDLYFERVKNALGFANRASGKTFCVAILNHLDMLFKPGCEIASAGAVLDQAEKCYRYFVSFLYLPWFRELNRVYRSITGTPLLKKTIRSYTEFGNGSVQEIITGTEKGLRSPHPHKARIDEIDLMDWGLLQTGLSMARGSDRIRGQNVFTSTRQRANGTMQRLLDSAVEKGIEVYEWNVWETTERCSRHCHNDPVHGSCPIWTFCEGRAHHCDGFFKIDDFIEKVRVLDRSTFETEWLNLRPRKDRYVYPMFGTKHIMTPDRLLAMTGLSSPSELWYRVCGLDFGHAPGHPFVFLKFCQLPNGAWLQMYEYVAEQRLLKDHAEAIKSSPFFSRSDIIYADRDAQDVAELRALGISTRPAVKNVLVGIDYIKTLLSGFPPSEEPMLYVWYTCKHTIEEYGRYQWPIYADGRVDRTGLPMKVHDHCMDATRYALFSHKHAFSNRYSARTIVGV
ncbi:MAG: hypothetical protein QXG97_00075 [Nitrososphaerota archaeon]